MRIIQIAAMVAASAGIAAAQNVTVTGAGAMIPASGTGGGSTYPTLPANPGSSSVVAPSSVGSVTSIEITDLDHTWIGDLQLVLFDPNGVGHLIFLRPGYLNPGGAGNSGNFTGGTFVFVESGASNSLPTTSSTPVDPVPGTYNQTFDSGGATWVSGSQNIWNTPMQLISGASGTWNLVFYDWAGGDTGSFSSWTLNYREGGPGKPVCLGDGSDTPCPCGNTGFPGEGCSNSTGNGGLLVANGSASVTAGDLVLSASNLRPNQFGTYLQGDTSILFGSGILFGDGLRCAGTNVVRLQQVGSGPAGASSTSVDIAVQGGVLPGDTRTYQLWYRDPNISPCNSNFNLTNGLEVGWLP